MMNLNEIWDVSDKEFYIQQDKNEWMHVLNLLEKITKEKGKLDILEIGAFDGGTTYSFSNFAKSLITLDIIAICRFGGGRENAEKSITKIKNNCSDYQYIGEDSHLENTFNKVKDKKYDVLFIDGDHSYEGVKQDFYMYRPLVKDNGVIILHDVKECDLHKQLGCRVDILWKELQREYKNTEEVSFKTCYGIGIIYL